MKTLLVSALLITAIVIPLGAFTRLSDAGLGCPDWPGCYGYLDFRKAMVHVDQINTVEPGTLREAHKTWPEMVHRYFASVLGFLIMLLAFGTWRKQVTNAADAQVWGKLPYLLFVLVCFQGLLGAWTVTMKLYPPTVVAHLFGGFFTFALLCWLTLKVFSWDQKLLDPELANFRFFSLATLLVLLIQIALGGWMSANYAALVCTQLPICEPGWLDKLVFSEAFSAPYDPSHDYEFGLLSHEARVTIHTLHRVVALILSAMLVSLVLMVLISKATHHSKLLACVLFSLLFVQVVLGLSNVIFSLPLAVAVAHNGFGALLLAAMLYFNHLAFKSNSRNT
jgi:heme a synthase